MYNLISIDPGKSGYLFTGRSVHKFDIQTYINIIKNSDTIVLEKVHSMPTDGVVSAFSFGENVGIIKGIIYSFNKELIEVTPQEWKKYFNLIGMDKKSTAIKLVEDCPEYSAYILGKRGGYNHNISDSIYIWRYYYETRARRP